MKWIVVLRRSKGIRDWENGIRDQVPGHLDTLALRHFGALALGCAESHDGSEGHFIGRILSSIVVRGR